MDSILVESAVTAHTIITVYMAYFTLQNRELAEQMQTLGKNAHTETHTNANVSMYRTSRSVMLHMFS